MACGDTVYRGESDVMVDSSQQKQIPPMKT